MPNALLDFMSCLSLLRRSGREKRNARLVKIISESAALLKCVHYVPQPPFKTFGAVHSKVCNSLHGFLFMGCREGVLKVTT